MTATPSTGLWCVKHKGRPVALVTGVDRAQAAEHAATLVPDMHEDDMAIAAVGDARPGALPVVMDLRGPRKSGMSTITPAVRAELTRTRAVDRAAKREPFIDIARKAFAAACKVTGYDATVNPMSKRASDTRFGFYRACKDAGLPTTISAIVTASRSTSIATRLREVEHTTDHGPIEAAAYDGATRVLVAGMRKPC